MKKTLLLFIAFAWSVQLFSQQYPLFTNYVLNDFGFNPAIAGSTKYWDARMTYRSQWVGIDDAPQTQVVSIQGPTKLVGVGGYFYNDQAGKLRRTGGSGAVCYAINFDSTGNRKLGFGLAGGMYNFRLVNMDDTSSDPAIAASAEGKWKPEVSAGIYLNWDKYFFGFSVPQIMKTKLTFSDVTNLPASNLIPHYYGMAGMRQPLNDKLILEPSVLVKYFQNAPLQFDVTVRAHYNNKFWAGAGLRYKDAAVGMVGYEITRSLTLAYAYDFTFTELRQASSGSHEISLGIKFGNPRDRDGDGVPDKEDDCPDVPGTKENGCPEDLMAEMTNDRDRDGVLDDLDQCPDVAGLIELNGCPLDDNDKDGIRNSIDKCPDVFGVVENSGCPLDDRDLDGIVDAMDRCPDIAGPIANQGCPDGDKDGDAVADALDDCPNTPGSPKNAGCPTVTEAEKFILDLAIQNLYFDTNKDRIKTSSHPFLDKLAELLVKQPEYRVHIEGYTDSVGSAEFNLDLSKRRAEAVRFYMLNRGVAPSQLTMNYFGEEAPAASNVNEDTRALNRRVEMSFVWD